MVGDRGKIIMGDERGTPDLKEIIDNGMGEMRFEVEDIGKLEPLS